MRSLGTLQALLSTGWDTVVQAWAGPCLLHACHALVLTLFLSFHLGSCAVSRSLVCVLAQPSQGPTDVPETQEILAWGSLKAWCLDDKAN